MLKIKVEKEISLTTEQKRLLSAFSSYCVRALGIKEDYDCILAKNKKKFGIVTTAVCLHDKKRIAIYAHGRLFADVLRSIAHEMSHIRQIENGKSPGLDYLHFSSNLEDNANEMAGRLLNAFSAVMGGKEIYDSYIG